LGLGVLSVAPSSAAVVAPSLTLGTATSAVSTGESATTTLTNSFIATANYDSNTVAAYITSSNASSASVKITLANADSSTSVAGAFAYGIDTTANDNVFTVGTETGNRSVTAKYNLYLVNPSAAGTYTVVFYQTANNAGAVGTSASTTIATWTVTVTAASTTVTALHQLQLFVKVQDLQQHHSVEQLKVLILQQLRLSLQHRLQQNTLFGLLRRTVLQLQTSQSQLWSQEMPTLLRLTHVEQAQR